MSTDRADWQIKQSPAGGVSSLRLSGVELLAGEAGPSGTGSARWQVAVGADRIRFEPASFELSQSMVWPLRYEPGMEVVVRGKNFLPIAHDTEHVLHSVFTVRLVWPAGRVAASIAWDEPRLRVATLAHRQDPPRIELALGPGEGRAVRNTSWWVQIQNGGGAPSIEVVDYDPAWPRQFAMERARVLSALGHQVAALKHGGSTSVPGLAAKPIIDMWAALRRPLDDDNIQAMAAIDYEYVGEAALEDNDLFVKRVAPVCHLHCYPAGHPELARHLAFRDWLRAHPDGAAAYAQLKRELAMRFSADRLAYTEAKSDFIEGAL